MSRLFNHDFVTFLIYNSYILHMMSEAQLIKECQNGNLDRFAEIYDAYVNKIYRFVYYRTNHKETAEDITSVVFMKSMNKISSYSFEKGTFSSWLYKIARNSVIDYYRSKKDVDDIDDFWNLGEDNNLDRRVDANMKLDEIKEYLKKFSDEQREIIIMRIWDGLSYKEISEITGKNVGALKVTVSRILKKIKNEPNLAGFIIFLQLIS